MTIDATAATAAIDAIARKEARPMLNISGQVMSGDTVIGNVKNGVLIEYDETRIPLYLKRTKYVEGWLASRAIDAHRTNSRLLKRALRIRTSEDAQVALAVNAATITDNYWFRPDGSSAIYEQIRFKENYFDNLALRGDPNGFSHKPSRTPELTNTGSFEKCWRLIDGAWWMFKKGSDAEYFSELLICLLGESVGFPIAHYEMDGQYIKTKDFTDGAKQNFEPIASLTDDDDYSHCFDTIHEISPALAREYLLIVWLDTICYNMDRHTGNFGFLRDTETGTILSMAPNYDNNIALISNGYPSDVGRKSDGLIRFFREFLQENPVAHAMYREMELPTITEAMVEDAIADAYAQYAFDIDRDYVKSFILNGYHIVTDMINDIDAIESDDEFPGLMM